MARRLDLWGAASPRETWAVRGLPLGAASARNTRSSYAAALPSPTYFMASRKAANAAHPRDGPKAPRRTKVLKAHGRDRPRRTGTAGGARETSPAPRQPGCQYRLPRTRPALTRRRSGTFDGGNDALVERALIGRLAREHRDNQDEHHDRYEGEYEEHRFDLHLPGPDRWFCHRRNRLATASRPYHQS